MINRPTLLGKEEVLPSERYDQNNTLVDGGRNRPCFRI